MATGALDANGIWQYGEDDSEPTFSGMLNKLASSTSTTVTRLEELSGLTAAQLTTHRDNLGVGLVNVVPTSVAQSGGSATANSLGTVSFTAVTSLSLNNVFTSAYRNYKIVFSVSAASANLQIRGRLRVSGVDASSTNYVWGGPFASHVGTVSAYTGSGIAYYAFGEAYNTATLPNASEINLYGPAIANHTPITFNGFYHNGSVVIGVLAGGKHEVSTAYDGITFYPSTGNITGTVQVFGYND